MSNIFVANITGTGTYAVPESDAQLTAATAGLDTHINAIPNLDYARVLAWIETLDKAGAPRTLNCIIEQFSYTGEECPDAAETITLTAAIAAELIGDANITAVGSQQVNLFQAGTYFLWSRNIAGGYLHPTTAADDIAVGAGPNGMWFQDGDLVLGAAAMSGTERLRNVGTSYLQGNTGINTPPIAAVGLDIEPLGTLAGTVYGSRVTLATTDDIPAWYGFLSDPTVNTGDVAADLYGFSAADVTVDGAIGTYYGIFAAAATANATNAYGVFISDMDATTLNYGVYQAGADDWNYFEGPVGIKDATPSYQLDVNGDINVQTGNAYRLNAAQLLTARKTGWAAATGTKSRATFATATVTLPQLAARVGQFIDDCIGHGLIGA
jgi:hypothetical protein